MNKSYCNNSSPFIERTTPYTTIRIGRTGLRRVAVLGSKLYYTIKYSCQINKKGNPNKGIAAWSGLEK